MYPKANKNLGQHFLIDQNIIKKITSDYAQEADVIIEVGPGPGVLTQHLAKHNKPLFVFELDKRFEEILVEYVPRERIIMGDALGYDWNQFFYENQLTDKNVWLVSNLPYQVSSALFLLFLQLPPIKFLTLMFQKEVAEKISPPKQSKNAASSLRTLGENFFDMKHLVKAPPGCFRPQPKVDSLVLTGARKDRAEIALEDFSLLESFVRLIFSQKRKQLAGLLKKRYPQYSEIMTKLGLEQQIRAETLEHEQIISLFKELGKSHGN